MFNQYNMLHLMIKGAHVNTFIKGTVPAWLVKHRDKGYVVISSWRISRSEYLALKPQTELK